MTVQMIAKLAWNFTYLVQVQRWAWVRLRLRVHALDLLPTSHTKPRLVKSVKLSCYQSNYYRLRHTHHFESLRGEVDIHTLSKQMGNSAAMIERHYSKLTATMAAEQLA